MIRELRHPEATISLDRVHSLWKDMVGTVMCGICGGLARDIVICEAGCSFCRLCIQDFAKLNSGRCFCGSPAFFPLSSIDVRTRRVLDGLTIRCENQNCLQELLYNDLEPHQATCGFRLVECGCGVAVPAFRIRIHQSESGCELVPCLDCGERLHKKAMQAHVSSACLSRPAACAYCHKFYKKRTLEDHKILCPAREVACVNCGMSKRVGVAHNCILALSERVAILENKLEQQQRMAAQHVYEEKIAAVQEKRTFYETGLEKDRSLPTGAATQQTDHDSYCPNCYEPTAFPQSHCPILYLINCKQLLLYNVHTLRLKSFRNPLHKRYKLVSSARVGTTIYVSGGQGRKGPPLKLTESLQFSEDLTSISHASLSDMSNARAIHTLLAITHSTIIAIGGNGRSSPISSCETYDISKDEWIARPAMNKSSVLPAACCLDQKWVYVFGSLNSPDGKAITIERWMLGGEDKWEKVKCRNSPKEWDSRCNGVVVEKDEVLMLNSDGVGYAYMVEKNEFAKRGKSGEKSGRCFQETAPVLWNGEAYFFDEEVMKVWVWSRGQLDQQEGTWRVEAVRAESDEKNMVKQE